jgi:Spy/CpxP family protein refolding chaperone
MKKMTSFLVAAALSSFLVAGAAWGSGMPAGTEGNSHSSQLGQDTWGCGLNLSAEQTQKMRDLQAGFLKETSQLQSELKAKEIELRTLWDRRNPDQEKILNKQKEINALEAQLQEKARGYRLEALSYLAPEQKVQLGTFPRLYEGYELTYGMKSGLGLGRGMAMGYGTCPRW